MKKRNTSSNSSEMFTESERWSLAWKEGYVGSQLVYFGRNSLSSLFDCPVDTWLKQHYFNNVVSTLIG